jgi:hypothetical protein
MHRKEATKAIMEQAATIQHNIIMLRDGKVESK